MNLLKRGIPVTLALLFGLATLAGLLFFPALGDTILGWAAFLAAVTLFLGIFNLLAVHARRGARGNVYSIVLVFSILAVFALAITDRVGLTEEGVGQAFSQIQVPLEAAVSSLLAFFLLFAGARILRRRRSWWSILFVLSALLFLLTQGPLPTPIASLLQPARAIFDSVLVTAGMRGLLLGVALGVITLSLRLLAGVERPYSL